MRLWFSSAKGVSGFAMVKWSFHSWASIDLLWDSSLGRIQTPSSPSLWGRGSSPNLDEDSFMCSLCLGRSPLWWPFISRPKFKQRAQWERAVEKKEGERGGEREERRRKDNMKRQRSHQREDATTDKKKGLGGGGVGEHYTQVQSLPIPHPSPN